MANKEHLARLKLGVDAWNRWRDINHEIQPSLRRANLTGADLAGADLAGADLAGADLSRANLSRANLSRAYLLGADLAGADLGGANLFAAILTGAHLAGANLVRVNLSGADLSAATLVGANLRGAHLNDTDLSEADLSRADLGGVNFCRALLVETGFEEANLTGCYVYGISAWNVNLVGAQQSDLVITQPNEPVITVDNLEVAQFIYLLLHNEKIREVIDTITSKAVLILGRFTPERKAVLDAIRDELRHRDYLPIVFDFERPTDRDFTETIMTLAGMCLFIIADITNPKSSPLELQATIPNYMVPLVPIIQEGEQPFAMFKDLRGKFDWVLDLLAYDSASHLIRGLEKAVIQPALKKHNELLSKKAEELRVRHIRDYLADI